jgi:hypothetical protein
MTAMKKTSYFDSIDFDSLLDDLIDDDSFLITEGAIVDWNETLKSFPPEFETSVNCRTNFKAKSIPKQNITGPKAFKCDVRRSYAHMFANVVNSMDVYLWFGFFDTYFNPNFQQQSINFNPVTNEPYFESMSGVATLVKFWYSLSQIAPDVVFRLSSTDMHSSPYTDRCKLVAKFTITATKIYDVSKQRYTQDELQRNEDQLLSVGAVGRKRKKNCSMGDKLCVVDRIASSVAGLTRTMPLSVNPLMTRFGGTLTMHVDESSRVGRLVISGDASDMNLDK